MSKRILSMFLVVVMLILAVPVFALPSLAGGAGYPGAGAGSLITSSTLDPNNNWPTANAVGTNGTAGAWEIYKAGNETLFGEGWAFGHILADGTFAPNLATNTQYATLNDDPLGPWNSTLLYLGGADAAKISGGAKGQTMGFAWTAPAEGTLDLNFAFGIWANGAASIEGYGIMVDGKLVWPAQPTEEGAAPVWGTIEARNYNDNIKNIAVKAGSTVAFVWKMKTSGNGDGLLRFHSASCTYTSIVESTGANYTVDLGAENRNGGAFTTSYPSWWMEFEKRADLVFNGHFTIGHYDEVGNYILIDKPNNAANWFSSSTDDDLWGGSSNAGYMITSKGICPTREEVVVRYVAEFTGKITPSITDFANVGDNNCTGTALYSIAVNGEIVWPANCTDYNDADTAFVATPSDTTQDWKALMNAAMAETSFTVNAGDRIDFIMRRGTTWNSVRVTPAYTYTEIDYTVPMTFKFVNAEAGTTETVMVTPNEDGTVNFTTPDAGDTLGWFEIDAAGRIISADAYQGSILKEGKTFYAFSKTATLAPGKSWPTVVNGKILYPSTIGFGKRNSAGAYTPFNNYDSTHQILDGGNQWGNTGSFLYIAASENRFVNATDGAVTVRWTALVDGTVEVDFKKLSIDRVTDGNANMHSDTAFVIMKNGTIVWPKTAAGTTFNLAEGLKGKEGTWFYAELPDNDTPTSAWGGGGSYQTYAATGSLLETLNAYLETDALPQIEVEAGDNVEIVFAKLGTPHISVNAAVSYVEVAEDATLWDGIVTKVPLYSTALVDNKPTDTWSTETRDQLTATFRGNWVPVGYKNSDLGDLDKALVLDTLINFGNGVEAATDNNNTFYSVAGTSLGGYPAIRAHGGGSYWGNDGIAVSAPATWGAGWRYTADYTGLVDLSFDIFNNNLSDEAAIATAVFVNGQMVWPTAGGAANKTDGTTWYDDWYQIATAGDYTAELNALEGLKNVFIQKGDVVEFLICGAGDIYGNKAVMSPAISYNTLTSIEMKAEMALNYYGAFGIDFYAPYALYDVVPEELLGALTLTVNGEEVALEGTLGSITGIAAKNLIDEMTWSFDAVIAGKKVNLGSGTTSGVDYLYSLLESEYAEDYKATVVAVLNYAAAAQTYFGYETDNLANAGLSAEDKTLADNTATSVLDKATLEGSTATITGFTLLLQDKVVIKTFIDAANATGLKLEVLAYLEDTVYNEETGEYEDIAGWSVIAESELTACAGGDGYKAYFEVENTWDYSTAYQFRVVNADGEAVSDTVTYSVESYIARKADSEAAELLKALLAYATNV